MKALMLLLCAGIFFSAKAQDQLSADVYLGQPYLTDINGGPVNSNAIGLGSKIKLHVDFLNLEQDKVIPGNTLQVIISLGNKLRLAGDFDIDYAPLNNYFSWQVKENTGQQLIVGTLKSSLPHDFAGLGVFELTAVSLGSSITNSKLALDNLVDPDLTNNKGELSYTVAPGLPILFNDFSVTPVSCDLTASWKVQNEANVDHYELELSKSGVNFKSITLLSTKSGGFYQTRTKLPSELKAHLVYVRIKAVSNDGSVYYTNINAIDGDCMVKQKSAMYVYPNPVTDINFINVAIKEESLNGKYRITLLDKYGKVHQVKEMTFANVKTLRFPLSSMLRNGKYILQVSKADGSDNNSLEFEKIQ